MALITVHVDSAHLRFPTMQDLVLCLGCVIGCAGVYYTILLYTRATGIPRYLISPCRHTGACYVTPSYCTTTGAATWPYPSKAPANVRFRPTLHRTANACAPTKRLPRGATPSPRAMDVLVLIVSQRHPEENRRRGIQKQQQSKVTLIQVA